MGWHPLDYIQMKRCRRKQESFCTAHSEQCYRNGSHNNLTPKPQLNQKHISQIPTNTQLLAISCVVALTKTCDLLQGKKSNKTSQWF